MFGYSPIWMPRVGMRLRDCNGVVTEVTSVTATEMTVFAAGWPPLTVEISVMRNGIESGLWVEVKGKDAEPRCVSCGELNEFRNGPFTCWRCQHWK